jgi:hypothetical protein
MVAVPTEAELVTYFTSVGAGTLLNPIALTAINTVRFLAALCPIPHAWASYFQDSKSPYNAWRMGVSCLVAALGGAEL